MSEKTSKGEDEILGEAIRYVIAASKGQTYKYPEGWDKNMKRSVRKRADRVTVRGVKVVYCVIIAVCWLCNKAISCDSQVLS